MENNRINFYDYIKNRLPELYKDGIILLDSLSKSKMWHVFNNIKKFSDVSGFTVGADNHQRIVLKHKVNYTEFINIGELCRAVNQTYNDKDFETCIKAGRKLLTITSLAPSLYGKIGISYIRVGEIDTAITYLTVATELSKKEHTNYDYTDIIYALRENKKNIGTDIEIKPKVKMTEEDFKQDNAKIDNLADIAIDFSAGVSINEIANKYNLDMSQICIVMLAFAEQYYIDQNDIMGDKCLKWIERVPDKSNTVKRLYKRLIEQRKLYQIGNKYEHTDTKKLNLTFRKKI